jgi:hypothetical protein
MAKRTLVAKDLLMNSRNKKLPTAPVYEVRFVTGDGEEHHQEYQGDLQTAQTCFDQLSRHGRDVVEVELTKREEGGVEGIDFWENRKLKDQVGFDPPSDAPESETKPAKQPLQAEPAYEQSHLICQDLLERIRELTFDLPAPGGETEINWEQVGTMNHVNAKLSEVIEFLKG